MADQFRVTGEFCVAGNPTKAWAGGTEPDDVWESQVHPFKGNLAAAKAFVLGLDPQLSTHVTIEHSTDGGATWELVVAQDADADWVADATPGEVPPSQRDLVLPGEHVIDESLTPYPAQEDLK